MGDFGGLAAEIILDHQKFHSGRKCAEILLRQAVAAEKVETLQLPAARHLDHLRQFRAGLGRDRPAPHGGQPPAPGVIRQGKTAGKKARPHAHVGRPPGVDVAAQGVDAASGLSDPSGQKGEAGQGLHMELSLRPLGHILGIDDGERSGSSAGLGRLLEDGFGDPE